MPHEVRLDSHDVMSGADYDPSDWTFKPSLGVVHAKGCSICNSYMTHLIVANDSNNASFQVAIRDRECLVSKAFLDGAQHGRQLQQEYDVPVLDRYRKELDKALQSLEQRQKLLDAAKQEIGILQDRTLALQMQLDDQVSSKTKRSAQSNLSSIERLLLNPSEDVAYLDAISPLSSTADKIALPITSDPPTISEDTTSVPSFSTSPDSPDSVGRINSLAEHGSQPSKPWKPKCGSSTHTQRPEQPAPNQLEPAPTQLMPEPTPKPTTPMLKQSTLNTFSTETAQDSPPIVTVAHLQALMDAAHAGDASALKRVKAFSGSAYQTPVNARTVLQHYVVKYWRKSPRFPSVPAQRRAVDVPFHTEIYVDASQWGIGFVMDGMWSAWKFSDSLVHSSSPSSPIDISWSEMVAVEVGLWTVIHWVTMMVQNEGEKLPLQIDVRCDNAGVVKAVEKRSTACVPQQDVLQRIFEVVRTFNVRLSIKWIASAQNLADGPSRGIACHGTTQLPLIPSLPSYLSDILNPISTNQ